MQAAWCQLRSETDRRQAVEQQIPTIREDARLRIEPAERQVRGLQETHPGISVSLNPPEFSIDEDAVTRSEAA